MRNGVEIGRSAITLVDPGTPLGTHAFVMKQDKAGAAPTWVGVTLSGQVDGSNQPTDPDALKRIHVPDAFARTLSSVLGGGSTLMITDEPVLESTTGVSLAVLSSSPEDTSAAPE